MKASPGPGSTETASEGAEDLLYDVLVLREWTSTGAAASKNGNSAAAAITTAESALSATSGDCKVAIADEVDDGGGGVGVLHGGAIEILAKTPNGGGGGGGYVGVTKVPVPPDECPQLSRLTWSSDGRLLVHAASNGRIFVYDESGTPIYSILSQESSLVSIPTDTE